MALGPLPPDELVVRVGVPPEAFPTPEQRASVFTSVGQAAYGDICSALPEGWSWEGKRVLDFGCGCGRILRWFLPHVEDGCELVACDIHAPTIEWMRANYPPGVRFDANEHEPPVREPEASFDLIYAGSVFSHLTDWAPWLLEMRRLLRPGGLLVASLHGRGFWPQGLAGSRGEPWDEDATGLLVEYFGASFEDGGLGPAVYVSEWWLRAHWGRALEIVRYEPAGFALTAGREGGQAWVVARRSGDEPRLEPEQLLDPSDDERELPAALRAQRLAYLEVQHHLDKVAELWREVQKFPGLWERIAELEAELARRP
jgi:SAM-dependent methyltransferase